MTSVPANRTDSPDDAYGEVPPVNEEAESRGSSVSSRLQDEYDNVLKAAVLMPNVESIPAIVEQFLGQVAREVDSYPPGHAFSNARLSDVSDDGNPRPTKPVQVSKQSPGHLIDLSDGNVDIIDVLGKNLSATGSSESQEISRPEKDKQHQQSTFESRNSQMYLGSNLISLSQTTTTESDKPFPHGALPRSRFVPEKEPSAQPVVTKSFKLNSKKARVPLMYTAPIRTSSANNDVSGASALDQLVNTDGDSDLVRTENLLDQWSGELKRNILAEFSQAKCRIAGNFHHLLNKEKEKHTSDLRSFREEVDSVRELLATYELSLTRKDQVISNLTQSLHRHRDRCQMQKRFAEWRQQHADKKREAFCTKLAMQHYERSLYRQVWNAWHSLLVGKWRHRVERACQAKAQEVCLQLTNDYEAKLASLNEALEASRIEVQRLHRERDWYEENMKKAFMRGVCALNMEALGMFRPPDNENDTEETADTPSEPEFDAARTDGQIPILPFFAPKAASGAGQSLSTTAPVYTVTRETTSSVSQAPLKGSSTFNGRRSGAENAPPQRVLRAHMIARETTRPQSSPLLPQARKGSPTRKVNFKDPSDTKKVHFASKR